MTSTRGVRHSTGHCERGHHDRQATRTHLDGSYEPTQAELEEPVRLEGAHEHSFEEVVGRILSYEPPPDATLPDEA